MFLLDTNIVSELRKPRPHGAVVAWLRAQAEPDLFLSSLTLGELQRGVEKARKNDAAKARAIELWIDEVAESFRVLAVDGPIFREWARIVARRSEHLFEDALIAATARAHQLTVVTRNVRDFRDFDVKVLDPFAARP